MLSIHESASLEEASSELLDTALAPEHWRERAASEGDGDGAGRPDDRGLDDPRYQRRVGALRVCAALEVGEDLGVTLRVSFRAPGLTPTRAAEHLEAFLGPRLPLLPNTEWQVEVDERRWIHFSRRYLEGPLEA